MHYRLRVQSLEADAPLPLCVFCSVTFLQFRRSCCLFVFRSLMQRLIPLSATVARSGSIHENRAANVESIRIADAFSYLLIVRFKQCGNPLHA